MAGDDKTIKVVHEHLVRGDQQALKTIKDQTAAYRDLDTTVQRTRKSLEDMLKADRDLGKQLDENIRKIREQKVALQGVQSGSSTWNAGGSPPNVSFGRVTPFGGGGRIPPGGIRGVLAGQSPYAGGYGQMTPGPFDWAKLGGSFMKGGAMLGAAGTLVGQGTDLYTTWQEHKGRQEIKDKTQGLENLARSQSFRNYRYQEAMTSPIGYIAMKNAMRFSVRTADSAEVGVDANGRITGADAGNMRAESSGSAISRASRMTGENRLIEAQKAHGLGHMVAGGLGILGGLGMIGGAAMGGAKIGAGLGTMLAPGVGTAIGGVAGGLIGGAGAMMLTSSFKEALGGFFEEKSASKKLRTGELSAEQSEAAVRAERAIDEIAAIKRSQLMAFGEASPERLALARQTIGTYAGGVAVAGYSQAETGAAIAGGLRQFGAVGGGIGRAALGMGNMGMGVGAAAHIMGMGATTGNGGAATMERVVAAGFAQGWKQLDMTFFEKIGGAFADGLYSPGGGMRGAAAGAALFSGLGPNPNQLTVGENLRGGGVERSIFGSNAYFQSQAMLQASNILGENATGLEIGALGKASMADLLGGTDKLKALGITEGQRKSALTQRLGSLGNVLGGADKRIGAMQGGGTFQELLQGLAGDLGNKSHSKEAEARRTAAKGNLDRIAAVASEMLGEEDFGGLEGFLRQAGVSERDMKHFVNATGSKKRFTSKIGGREAAVVDAETERRHKQAQEGKSEVLNPLTVADRLRTLEAIPEGERTEENTKDIEALNDSLKTGGRKSNYRAVKAVAHAGKQQGDEAQGAGGYGATQQLLGDFKELSGAIEHIVGILNSNDSAWRKLKAAH